MGFDGERQIRCCKKCGELEWDTVAKFCKKCGEPLAKKKEDIISAKECPKCGVLSTTDSCVICGRDLKYVSPEEVFKTDPRW